MEKRISFFLCAVPNMNWKQLRRNFDLGIPMHAGVYKDCDVSDKTNLMAFAEWVSGKAGKTDILVNNARYLFAGERIWGR